MTSSHRGTTGDCYFRVLADRSKRHEPWWQTGNALEPGRRRSAPERGGGAGLGGVRIRRRPRSPTWRRRGRVVGQVAVGGYGRCGSDRLAG
jgi:hypothetical protein